jgi:hypothetical protein
MTIGPFSVFDMILTLLKAKLHSSKQAHRAITVLGFNHRPFATTIAL